MTVTHKESLHVNANVHSSEPDLWTLLAVALAVGLSEVFFSIIAPLSNRVE